jgi:hypothetical protein
VFQPITREGIFAMINVEESFFLAFIEITSQENQ